MSLATADMKSVLVNHMDDLAQETDDRIKTVDIDFDGAGLHCRFAQVDRLACQVDSIVVASTRYQQLGSEQLQQIASDLSKRLSYLEERLVVLEIDQETPEVQMRSVPPREDSEGCCYFEVKVSRHGISLRRFRKQTGTARQAITATLTHDVLTRICGDLLAA